MDTITLAQRTINLLNSMIEGGECHTSRSIEMKENAKNKLEELRTALAYEREEYIKWLEIKIQQCSEDKDLERECWAFRQSLKKFRK